MPPAGDGGGGGVVIRANNYQKLYIKLIQILSPTFDKKFPNEIYNGKLETFLICRKLAEVLRENVMKETAGNFFEEVALDAVYRSLQAGVLNLADVLLLLNEIPNILPLKYPVVKDICNSCIQILPQVQRVIQKSITGERQMTLWKNFEKYDYLLRLLKSGVGSK